MEGNIISQQIDEFEVSSEFTLEDVKNRVKAWLRMSVGKDYIFNLVNEHNITLTKMKHDARICGVACILIFVVPFAVIFGIRLPYPITFETVLLFVGILIFSIGAVMAIGIGLYCLRPEKSIFTVHFSPDHPVRVRVFHEGGMLTAKSDYSSFRAAILSQNVPQTWDF